MVISWSFDWAGTIDVGMNIQPYTSWILLRTANSTVPPARWCPRVRCYWTSQWVLVTNTSIIISIYPTVQVVYMSYLMFRISHKIHCHWGSLGTCDSWDDPETKQAFSHPRCTSGNQTRQWNTDHWGIFQPSLSTRRAHTHTHKKNNSCPIEPHQQIDPTSHLNNKLFLTQQLDSHSYSIFNGEIVSCFEKSQWLSQLLSHLSRNNHHHIVGYNSN